MRFAIWDSGLEIADRGILGFWIADFRFLHGEFGMQRAEGLKAEGDGAALHTEDQEG